ncbi:MAG: cytochrome c oxidase assembly protein [Myxococcales bacterium]|nr:cytochrome c oxidase assembly protein [Myxococcales bacterium]
MLLKGALLLLLAVSSAYAHTGVVMPWDSSEFDYSTAPPEAWKVLDLHVTVLLGVLLFCLLYHQAVTTWRVRHGWSDVPISRWRQGAFYLGQIVLLLSLNGPVHHLSDNYLFTAHMVQHLMMNLIWAPLTVLGLPEWLVEAALSVGWLRKVSDFLGRLPVKFLVYNGALFFWHVPYMYDLAIRNHNMHIVEHIMFMVTSVIAWFGLLCTAPSVPKPHRFAQLLYLFAMTLPMKLLGAIITLSTTLIYQGYVGAPRIWGITPLFDQRYGGLLMWVPGGFVLWSCMIYVFSQWLKEERAAQAVEAAAHALAQGAGGSVRG